MDSDFDFGQSDHEDHTATDQNEYPLHTLDEEIFGEAWISQMEALDSQPAEQLYLAQSTDGFVPTDWEIDEQAIQDSLTALGMDDRRLRFQEGDERGLILQVLNHLGLEPKPEQVEWHRRNMVDRIAAIVRGEPLAKRLRGEHLPAALGRISDFANAKPVTVTTPAIDLGGSMALWVPLPGTKRRTLGAHVAGTRELQEKKDRDKWAREVLILMQLASAPLFDLVSESFAPTAALLGALGATRGSTMESYFKAVKPFFRWLEIAHRLVWPTNLIQLVDFLHDVGAKPCAPTYPSRFSQAWTWFEKVGGWKSGERFFEMALFAGTVKFWTDSLSSGLAPLKQAARLPWCLVAALELLVVCDGYPKHVRFKAWTILLKHWATLREDDIQHAVPGRFRIVGELYINELMRSKTTGAAKRVRQLPFGVWVGATITRTMWLEAGIALMDELTKKDNDFLLPRFQHDGSPIQTPMPYSESASMTRTVLGLLKVPKFDEEAGVWSEVNERLLIPELHGFWSEHSSRPGMPSAAQVLGIHKDEANFLGRWSPSGAEDYSRAYRIVVQSIQAKVWKEVLAANEALKEHDVLDRLDSWGKERGLAEERILEVKTSLRNRCEDFWKEIVKTQGAPEEVPQDLPQPALQPAQLPQISKKLGERAGFVLVYGRNRRTAKLHKIDGCQWTNITFADSREVARPTPEMYSSRCKLCWPKLMVDKELQEENQSSSDSDL